MGALKDNPRITPKDRGLIKGAMRRAFARSELHEAVITRITVDHSDPRNPRCKNWGYCELCGVVQPRWKIQVDHIQPVVPIDSHFEYMSLDEAANRMWCDPGNLQGICEPCHDVKTASEKEARAPFKKPSQPRKKKPCAKT